MSYCRVIAGLEGERKALHQNYHDRHYGFPIDDDDELFCRLVLEINQAGLSWETILRKEAAFRKAYSNFNIRKVAAYGAADRKRLMADAGIIRNRLKIEAAIENAKTILALQSGHGSFAQWLADQAESVTTKDEWTKLFRRTFRFTGGEIVGEFLLSIGFLPGAHEESCAIYRQALKAKPHWARTRAIRRVRRATPPAA